MRGLDGGMLGGGMIEVDVRAGVDGGMILSGGLARWKSWVGGRSVWVEGLSGWKHKVDGRGR